jgi:hypothetical protein
MVATTGESGGAEARKRPPSPARPFFRSSWPSGGHQHPLVTRHSSLVTRNGGHQSFRWQNDGRIEVLNLSPSNQPIPAMATKSHGPSIKKDKTYERLREKGESKEKAARIANAQANPNQSPSKKGGRSSKYEDWSKDELTKRAREIGIEGRSKMNKSELIDALRNH